MLEFEEVQTDFFRVFSVDLSIDDVNHTLECCTNDRTGQMASDHFMFDIRNCYMEMKVDVTVHRGDVTDEGGDFMVSCEFL